MAEMTVERALSVLRRHNDWRRGATDEWPDSAKEIGQAIDFACAVLSAPGTPDKFRFVDVVSSNGYAGYINLFWGKQVLALVPPPTATEIKKALSRAKSETDEITRLRARVAEMENGLAHISDYWNGSRNDAAMSDALGFITEESARLREVGK